MNDLRWPSAEDGDEGRLPIWVVALLVICTIGYATFGLT